MQLPVFEIDNIFDDFSGIHIISLVEDPAMEEEFIALSEEQAIPVEVNEEEMIVKGPVIIPNKQILRYSEEIGWYYLQFTTDVVRRLRDKYFKEGRGHTFNLGHSQELYTSNIYVVESYIRPEDGAWVIAAKVDEPEVWKSVKAGLLKGFSLEGVFDMKQLFNKVKQLFSKKDSVVLKLEEEVAALKQEVVETAEKANTAIEEANKAVETKQTEVAQKEEAIKTLTDKITALEELINSANTSLTEKAALIDKLNSEVSSLKETQVVIKPTAKSVDPAQLKGLSTSDKLKQLGYTK